MYMMKKGNLMSEPFTYIFIVMIIALIAFFGFKYVKDLTSFGCEVEAKKFVLDFKDKIDNMMSFSSGSKTKELMYVPKGVVGICFIDPSVNTQIDKIKFADIREDISILSESDVLKEQMFFSKSINSNDKCIHDRIRVDKLKIGDNPLCFDTSTGSFTFFLENKGKFVEIKHK